MFSFPWMPLLALPLIVWAVLAGSRRASVDGERAAEGAGTKSRRPRMSLRVLAPTLLIIAAAAALLTSLRTTEVATAQGNVRLFLPAVSGGVGAGAPPTTTPGPSPTPAVQGVSRYLGLSHDHISVGTPIAYAQTPPVGGAHWPVWYNCGFYAAPLQNEMAVHSMEHGAVWLTYDPSLATAQINLIHDLARRYAPKVLASPFAGLPSPVVATAWGWQLRLPSADDGRLEQFVIQYRNNPDSGEPMGECTGGTGSPLP